MAGQSRQALRTRIKSVQSTRKITKAMEMIANAKLVRSRSKMEANREYAQKLQDTVDEIVMNNPDAESQYVVKTDNPHKVTIVFASDLGLCGGYNANVMKMANEVLDKEDPIYVIGTSLYSQFKEKGYHVMNDEIISSDKLTFSELKEVMESCINMYQDGKAGTVQILYTKFVNTMTFTPDGPMKELDKGFDFYASQTAFQAEQNDKAILEGWFGCSDYSYPVTESEGWAGLQTLARELTIEDGKLIQRPVKALGTIKDELVFDAENGVVTKDDMRRRMLDACVIHLDNPGNNNVGLNLFATDLKKGFEISYDARKKTFLISREALVNQMNTDFGTERKITLDALKTLDIFVDHSAVEIFINDGETVMSSRIFPTKEEHKIRMSGKDINLKIWTIKPAVEDDFVIFEKGDDDGE